MLKKADRLTTADITALSQGKSVFGTLLSLRFTPSDRSKFAVSVSKKVASRAVDRNIIRRKVYDAIKMAQDGLKISVFAMILPKKECLLATPESISAEIRTVFKKAGLV